MGVLTGSIWLRIGTSGALVNTVMNLRVLSNFGKFFSGRATGGLSRRVQLHVLLPPKQRVEVLDKLTCTH
jgi:hypothetical protein